MQFCRVLKISTMKKIKLAVVTGGAAAELEVSLKSAAVVIANLDTEVYEVYKVDISLMPWIAQNEKYESFTIDLHDFSIQNHEIKFDAAFIAIHGTPAEDGKLQGYFDLLNIPYSACSVLASAITFDKDITKQLLKDVNINMAKSVLLNTEHKTFDHIFDVLNLPIFVKPNKNGSSYGISKVKIDNELNVAIEKAFQFDDEVLVEEFIDGRELAAGIIEDRGELICLPITEIISENEFFDYEAKYLGKSKEITPAEITSNQKASCNELTELIYRKLKLSGAVRIDYFLKGNDFYLLEVNTIPGLSAASILPQQAIAHGYSLSTFFHTWIQGAIEQKNNLTK